MLYSRTCCFPSLLSSNCRVKSTECRKFIYTSTKLDSTWKKHGLTITEPDTSQAHNKNPVVAIFGWNDSKEKHLKKYSDIFTQKNYTTLTTTAKAYNTFFRPGTKVKEIGQNILKVLDEMNCQDRPIFLYSFSNGGCAVYYHVMEALTSQESKYWKQFNVVGSIFDSCPIYTNMKSVKIVQMSITQSIGNPLLRGLVWYCLGMTVPLVVLLNPSAKRFIADMKDSSLMSNQLFLYSKSDHLAPYADIDEFIAARRSLGVQVTSQCWEKSSHVNHLREHHKEYLKVLNNFTEKCLIT